MTEDTAIINGAGSESLAPTMEAMFAFLTGVTLGFIYSWKMTLTTLLISPLLMFGGILDIEMQKDTNEKNAEDIKESTIFMGDCIQNFKTVQSFGYDDLVVKTFADLL